MSIIKVLIITLLAAIGAGCIFGIIFGKRSVKKAMEGSNPLLSIKERIIYAGMLLAGIACVLIGVFVVGGNGTEDTEMAFADGEFDQYEENMDDSEGLADDGMNPGVDEVGDTDTGDDLEETDAEDGLAETEADDGASDMTETDSRALEDVENSSEAESNPTAADVAPPYASADAATGEPEVIVIA